MKQLIRHVLYVRLLLFIFQPLTVNAAPPDAPYNLRSFDKYNPIGTDNSPYLGWYISDPDDNEIQSAYQIIVASSLSGLNSNSCDIWDSGKVISRKQNYVYSEGKSLLAINQC